LVSSDLSRTHSGHDLCVGFLHQEKPEDREKRLEPSPLTVIECETAPPEREVDAKRKEINEPGHITTGNVLEDLGFLHRKSGRWRSSTIFGFQSELRSRPEATRNPSLPKCCGFINRMPVLLLSRPNHALQHCSAHAVCRQPATCGFRLTVVPKLESQKRKKTARIPMRKTVPRRRRRSRPASPKTGRRAASA